MAVEIFKGAEAAAQKAGGALLKDLAKIASHVAAPIAAIIGLFVIAKWGMNKITGSNKSK